MRITLFDNGLVMAFEDNKQVAKAQKPWILVFAEYLKENGIDPTEQEIILPDGQRAHIFPVEDGFNWEIGSIITVTGDD